MLEIPQVQSCSSWVCSQFCIEPFLFWIDFLQPRTYIYIYIYIYIYGERMIFNAEAGVSKFDSISSARSCSTSIMFNPLKPAMPTIICWTSASASSNALSSKPPTTTSDFSTFSSSKTLSTTLKLLGHEHFVAPVALPFPQVVDGVPFPHTNPPAPLQWHCPHWCWSGVPSPACHT